MSGLSVGVFGDFWCQVMELFFVRLSCVMISLRHWLLLGLIRTWTFGLA